MRISEIRLVVISLMLTSLAACGGGGGGGAPPPSADTPFLTQDPDFDEPGEFKSFNLAGTATGNGQTIAITSSISLSRLANQMLNGEEVEVTERVIVTSFPNQGATDSAGNTFYVGLDGLLRQIVDTEGVICFPDANYSSGPDSVMIGQSGILGGLTCTDGYTETSTFLVETSAINNQWAAIRDFATAVIPGDPEIFVEFVTHVTPDGRIQAIELFADDGTTRIELIT